MKAVTAEEMQEIDRITINELGIPGYVLMGLAGKSVADYVLNKNFSRVVVFSGSGNNGGDGFVAAYFLANQGLSVDVFLTGKKEKVSETSGVYLNLCFNTGLIVKEINDNNIDELDFEKYDLIIDALLGTGFKGTVRGTIGKVINLINRSGKRVLAIDIPSGLPSNGESPQGETIKSDYTVTIGLPKISLVTYPGKDYTGELSVSDIGFPSHLINSDSLKTGLVDEDFFTHRFKEYYSADTHKGEKGHLLLVGGFDGMEGAIMMCAMAALETGAGLATLLTTEKARSIIAGKIPELMTLSIKDGSPDSDKIAEQVVSFLSSKRYNSMVIGPGMGRDDVASNVFKQIIHNISNSGINRVLIDGDGLFHLAAYLKNERLDKEVEFVITPHFGEASRILGKDINEIKKNRLAAAVELSKSTSSVALLKGPATIVSDGINSLINTSGNPALATAGSGDVLSGIIGSLMLREMPVIDSAGIGAFIHGKAADLYCKENKVTMMKATDIISCIRKVPVNCR